MKKRLLSTLLAVCMVIALLPVITPTAQAFTNGFSQVDAVAWIRVSEGTANDIDHVEGVQCVDLVKWYIGTLGHNLGSIGYAYNLYRYTDAQLGLPSWGWSRHYNDEAPQPGDIVVFDAGAYGAYGTGHCGLIYDVDINAGSYYYIDYNGTGKHDPGTKRDKPLYDFSCVIRPDWPYWFDAATGTLTISGAGAASFDAYNGVGSISNTDIKSIVIKDGITSIADLAFINCENLVNVTIPNSVTEIGVSAFYRCISLERIVIPNSVTSIEQQAFEACYALTDVTLPNKLTMIANDLFYDCISLSSISIPSSVTSIGSFAFRYTNLYSVTIPDGVTTLRDHAFMNCRALRTVYIPASVTSFGGQAFAACPSLRDVYYGGTKQQFDAAQADYGQGLFYASGNDITIHYENYNPESSTPGTTDPGNPEPEKPTPPSFKERLQQFIEDLAKNLFFGITTICCPVNVEILVDGQPVGRIEDNVVSGVDEDKLYVYVENDEKYICFLTPEDYTITLTATGTGTMEYSVLNMDVASWTTLNEKNFWQVKLTPGKEMVSYITYLETELIDTPNTQLYVLDSNNRPVAKVLPDDNSTEISIDTPVITFDTAVTSIYIPPIAVKDDGTLPMLPIPDRSEYTFNGWYTTKEGGTEVTKETKFTEDTTVYAHWTKDETPQSPTPEIPSCGNADCICEECQCGENCECESCKAEDGDIPGSNEPEEPEQPPCGSVDCTCGNCPGDGCICGIPDSDTDTSNTPDIPSTPSTPSINENVDSGDSSSSDPTYSITVPSRVTGGTVKLSPSNASEGQRVTITAKPNTGYELDTLSVTDSKGNVLTLTDQGDGKYTFTMPKSNVSIDVSFKATAPAAQVTTSSFTDVPANAYYADAVAWAVEKGITYGNGDGTFAPESTCSRANIVTFLWRAMGSPMPSSRTNPFVDADTSAYYYEAMLWAAENGITAGTGDGTTFDPNGACTRAQIVTFLWRANNKPTVNAGGMFSDVVVGSYYDEAVAWAVANGITAGTGDGTTFAPENGCTRGQCVTFLYRNLVG